MTPELSSSLAIQIGARMNKLLASFCIVCLLKGFELRLIRTGLRNVLQSGIDINTRSRVCVVCQVNMPFHVVHVFWEVAGDGVSESAQHCVCTFWEEIYTAFIYILFIDWLDNLFIHSFIFFTQSLFHSTIWLRNLKASVNIGSQTETFLGRLGWDGEIVPMEGEEEGNVTAFINCLKFGTIFIYVVIYLDLFNGDYNYFSINISAVSTIIYQLHINSLSQLINATNYYIIK